jgi:hypothetical protein
VHTRARLRKSTSVIRQIIRCQSASGQSSRSTTRHVGTRKRISSFTNNCSFSGLRAAGGPACYGLEAEPEPWRPAKEC